MARERDFAAEYARRKARAAAQGSSVFKQRDRAARSLGYRNYSQRAQARKTGEGLRPVDAARLAARDRRQIIPTPAGTVVRTTASGRGRGVIEGRIARAGAGSKVSITATVRLTDGTKRDVTIFGRGGWDAAQVAAGIAFYGSLAGFIAAQVAMVYGGAIEVDDSGDDGDGVDSIAAVVS